MTFSLRNIIQAYTLTPIIIDSTHILYRPMPSLRDWVDGSGLKIDEIIINDLLSMGTSLLLKIYRLNGKQQYQTRDFEL